MSFSWCVFSTSGCLIPADRIGRKASRASSAATATGISVTPTPYAAQGWAAHADSRTSPAHRTKIIRPDGSTAVSRDIRLLVAIVPAVNDLRRSSHLSGGDMRLNVVGVGWGREVRDVCAQPHQGFFKRRESFLVG
jgi:hypothetical protein